jgi:hypothetical protein
MTGFAVVDWANPTDFAANIMGNPYRTKRSHACTYLMAVMPRLQSFEDATQFDTILVSPPNNIR